LNFDEFMPRQMFGDEIWAIVTVAEGGALALTQKLHSTSFDLASNHGFQVTEPAPESGMDDQQGAVLSLTQYQ